MVKPQSLASSPSRHDTMSLTRRALLQAGAGSLLALALPGCCLLRPRPLGPFCSNDPAIANPGTPLTVDVHAHIFNGTDLQVKRFIELVVSKQSDTFAQGAKILGGALQDLAWERAPTARQEQAALRDLQDALAQCETHGAQLARLKEGGYSLAKGELNAAVDRVQAAPGAPAAPANAAAYAVIRALPPTYDDYIRQKAAPGPGAMAAAPGGIDVAGLIDFVIQNFQYRYVSAHDYLLTYSRGPARRIDLLVASLVDYDWWLAKGEAPPSSLRDQVDLMGQIAIATGGRVHAFAPFDPFREVMTRRTGASALALVKDAVVTHGAMGVKLYPPMGFAPFGNSGSMIWKGKDWLPDVAYQDGFGGELDAVLSEFFAWCIEEQVPVMAHTNKSNGPDPEFEKLALADHWKLVLDRIDQRPDRKLRINFGHFGDTTPVADGPSRSEAFVALMKSRPTAAGAMAFADASYFSDILDNAAKLQAILEGLYLGTQDQPGLLANRLMYGSDWEMSMMERNAGRYLSGFEATFVKIEASLSARDPRFTGMANRFFGRNAATFLGLAKGNMNRERIDRFYAKNRITTPPHWMTKVDRL